MDTNQIKNLVRVGIVSSTNGSACTAKVTFPDKDNMVSGDLPVIQIGANGTESYWIPEVGTRVLCLCLPNPSGSGMNAGFILGAYYTKAKPPPESDPDVRCIRFKDGSFIKYDHGTITINAASQIVLQAPMIHIN